MSRLQIIAALAVLLLSTAAAGAATLQFEAYLDGLQESPPNFSPGTGYASLTVDDVTRDFTLTGNFADLVGTTTIAHLQGPTAAIIATLTMPVGVGNGTLSGSGTFTVPQMTDLQNGQNYVNIRTNLFPGGEIRGQLGLVPEPGTFVLLALGGIGLAVAAWRRRRRTLAA